MKSFLFTLLIFVLTSCSTLHEELSTKPEKSRVIPSEVIPFEEALSQLKTMRNALTPQTRSGMSTDQVAISDVSVCGGKLSTRSGTNMLPDTMVYVVNFADDKGFAILGARRSLEPVFALTETGTFDANKLNDAISRATSLHPETEKENDSKGFTDIGTEILYDLMAANLAATPRIKVDTAIISYGEWETKKIVGPLVEVKWNQEYPFNYYMPYSDWWKFDNYKYRYPVGCSMVAAGQVMATVRKPNMAPGTNSASYRWSALKTVSPYWSKLPYVPAYDPEKVSPEEKLHLEQLADFLYYIGTCFSAQYSISGTGAYPWAVAKGMKQFDPDYYSNIKWANMPREAKLEDIYNMLDNNKPVFTVGYRTSGSGHAWVIDGVIEQNRQVEKMLKYAGTPWYETERRYFLHINWGYQGRYDGYFVAGIFDMSQRVAVDDVIDVKADDPGFSDYSNYLEVILF